MKKAQVKKWLIISMLLTLALYSKVLYGTSELEPKEDLYPDKIDMEIEIDELELIIEKSTLKVHSNKFTIKSIDKDMVDKGILFLESFEGKCYTKDEKIIIEGISASINSNKLKVISKEPIQIIVPKGNIIIEDMYYPRLDLKTKDKEIHIRDFRGDLEFSNILNNIRLKGDIRKEKKEVSSI